MKTNKEMMEDRITAIIEKLIYEHDFQIHKNEERKTYKLNSFEFDLILKSLRDQRTQWQIANNNGE